MAEGDLPAPERRALERLRKELRERGEAERKAWQHELEDMEEQGKELRRAIDVLLTRYPEPPAYVETPPPLPKTLKRSIADMLRGNQDGDP